ncbi:MAG: hypothetical protein HQL24_05530 [Candidatus Omnitrophica bacterium]|nr:hypothetical protein [Candidatus Omnitrophota bacterium]
MNVFFSQLPIWLSTLCFVVGIVLFLKPKEVIQFQIKFYQTINWRMEPISMPKEIQNTKLMGIFMVAITLLTVCYILRNRFSLLTQSG